MTPQEKNFHDYKKAEAKALEILAEMKGTSAKRVDIELALITAVFELHKGNLPPSTVANIIQTHLETIVPFYESSSQPTGNN